MLLRNRQVPPRLNLRKPAVTRPSLQLRPPVSPPSSPRAVSPPSSPPGSPRRVLNIDAADVKRALEKIAKPKVQLKAFVTEAQEQFPSLTLPQLQQYWRIQNLRRPPSFTKKAKGKKVGRKPLSTFERLDSELSGEQERALQDLFYRQHKGTLGVQALWEALRQEPWQEAALETGKGAVTWRTLRAWYNAQETNQLHRKAKPMSKTLVNVPTAEQLVPFARLQVDTLVMAKGNNKKSDDDLGWQTKSKKQVGLPDSKQRVVYNMIDLATNYNWLNAGPRAPNAGDAADSVGEFINAIKDMHQGKWPIKTVLYVDGGPEYSEAFQKEITTLEPLITVKVQQAYNPNSNAYIEGSMSLLRRTMKRYAENMKASRGGNKDYQSYWFNKPLSGKAGQLLQEMNALMNTRPVKALGWQTPADVLKAYLDGDDEVISKSKESKLSTANKRRSSAKVTKYKTGDKARLISGKYLKSAGSRDNKLKQNPPWSRELYTISSVQGGIDTVPKYRLEEKGDEWYLHHQLQKIDEGIALPPPLAIVKEDMDYEPYTGLSHTPGRLFYRGFPMPEPESNLVQG